MTGSPGGVRWYTYRRKVLEQLRTGTYGTKVRVTFPLGVQTDRSTLAQMAEMVVFMVVAVGGATAQLTTEVSRVVDGANGAVAHMVGGGCIGCFK